MTIGLEEAIQTALDFEKKVYKVYADAMDKIDDPVGKKVFKQLSLEEAPQGRTSNGSANHCKMDIPHVV